MDGYGLKKALTGGDRWRRWGGEFEYRDFYGHTPLWRGVWRMCGVPQHCRETGKKVCSGGSWSRGADIHTVIGSSFIGAGTHILPDTSPHTPSSATNNKPTLAVIYTASVWLFRFKPMQQKKNKASGSKWGSESKSGNRVVCLQSRRRKRVKTDP